MTRCDGRFSQRSNRPSKRQHHFHGERKHEFKSVRCPLHFTVQEFPYYFEDGIEHHVVWSEKELTCDEVEKVIRENRNGYETVWFRNPLPLQTIPELWHVHVLSHLCTRAQRGHLNSETEE